MTEESGRGHTTRGARRHGLHRTQQRQMCALGNLAEGGRAGRVERPFRRSNNVLSQDERQCNADTDDLFEAQQVRARVSFARE